MTRYNTQHPKDDASLSTDTPEFFQDVSAVYINTDGGVWLSAAQADALASELHAYARQWRNSQPEQRFYMESTEPGHNYVLDRRDQTMPARFPNEQSAQEYADWKNSQ